ncbi:hypothetical protein [Bacillus toyonensis]|uniref:hypothetical protein n=1 Tax=Bacillus toyonensis TaxID=155322 RepID=UPI0032FEC077|nr:hypothetical protein [Bacillus toyonensis]
MLSKYTQKYESNYEHSIFTKYKNTDFYIDFRTTHSHENITFMLDYLRNHFCTRTDGTVPYLVWGRYLNAIDIGGNKWIKAEYVTIK